MIIWGSVGKETPVATGRFHCPQCNGQESYDHVRVQRFFTLYFIPLFPTQTLGEFVRCLSCKLAFKPEVLDLAPPNEMQRLVDAIDADLQSGTPVQMARRKLLNSGLAEKTADDVIASCTADGKKNCAKCNLDYASSIRRCANCGQTV
jgi:zinc-ribbon family